MNAAEYNALVYLVHHDKHEPDVASGQAMGEIFILGKLADKHLVDVRPGKTAPAYWINRRGLEEVGVVVQ